MRTRIDGFIPAAGLLAALLLTTGSPVAGQSAWSGVRMQSYLMRNSDAVRLHDVRLMSLPFGGRTPIASWAFLSVTGAYADAVVTLPNGETGSVSGVTDTQVQLEGSWRGITLAGTGVLPTGRVVQDVEEASLVGLVASELLPFSVTRWGTGGAYGADLAYSRRLGRTTLGLSGGYLAAGESTPLEGDGGLEDGSGVTYRPGSQTRVRLGVDAEIGEASVLSALVGYQTFGTDTYDEQNLFDPGTRLEARLSFSFPLGSGESATVFGGFYHRSAGSLIWSLASPPELGDVFPGASASGSRQLLLAGSELRISRRRFDLTPRVEARVLRSAEGRGQGWLGSFGARASYRLAGGRFGRRVLLEPTAHLRVGRLVPQEGLESDVVGWDAGVAVRWAGGR